MSAPKNGNTILNLGVEMVETFDWDQLHIPLDKIDERPGFNPRTNYGEADGSFASLVESIRDRGMLELPRLMPVVDKRGDWDPVECRFTIVSGHRRIAAARALGWESVRVCVPDADGKELAVYDDGQQLVDALIENLQRKELNCIEVAEGIARLEKLGKTQADIAKWIGRDQGRVSKTVRLLELPVGVRALLREGALSASHGEELLPLLSESFLPGEIYKLAQDAVDMSLTKSGLRNVVQDKIKRSQPVQTTIDDVEDTGDDYAPAHNSPVPPSPRSEGGSDPKPAPKDDMERQQLPSSNGLTRQDSDAQFAAAVAPDPDIMPLSERPAPPADPGDVSDRCWATHKMMTPQERQEWLFSKGLNTSRACDKLREVLEVPTKGFLGAVTLSEEGWALLRKLASVEPYTGKTDGTIVEALLLRRALELGIEQALELGAEVETPEKEQEREALAQEPEALAQEPEASPSADTVPTLDTLPTFALPDELGYVPRRIIVPCKFTASESLAACKVQGNQITRGWMSNPLIHDGDLYAPTYFYSGGGSRPSRIWAWKMVLVRTRDEARWGTPEKPLAIKGNLSHYDFGGMGVWWAGKMWKLTGPYVELIAQDEALRHGWVIQQGDDLLPAPLTGGGENPIAMLRPELFGGALMPVWDKLGTLAIKISKETMQKALRACAPHLLVTGGQVNILKEGSTSVLPLAIFQNSKGFDNVLGMQVVVSQEWDGETHAIGDCLDGTQGLRGMILWTAGKQYVCTGAPALLHEDFIGGEAEVPHAY